MRKVTLAFLIVSVLVMYASTPAYAAPVIPPSPVPAVQLVLRSKGYTTPVDGKLGQRTARAVATWQRANGLPATGTLDRATLRTLGLSVDGASLSPALRVNVPQAQLGLNGLPFAPSNLSGCEEAGWYAGQVGLPVGTFVDIAYGESRCQNSAANSCCVGWWQLNVGNFTAPGYTKGIHALCKIFVRSDIVGDSPLVKQKQACMASVMYNVWTHHGSGWPWTPHPAPRR